VTPAPALQRRTVDDGFGGEDNEDWAFAVQTGESIVRNW